MCATLINFTTDCFLFCLILLFHDHYRPSSSTTILLQLEHFITETASPYVESKIMNVLLIDVVQLPALSICSSSLHFCILSTLCICQFSLSDVVVSAVGSTLHPRKMTLMTCTSTICILVSAFVGHFIRVHATLPFARE